MNTKTNIISNTFSLVILVNSLEVYLSLRREYNFFFFFFSCLSQHLIFGLLTVKQFLILLSTHLSMKML